MRRLVAALHASLLAVAVLAVGASTGATAEINATAKAQEGSVELSAGRFDKAIELFTELLSDPDLAGDKRASLLNDRGVAHWRLGNLPAAIEDFNAAIGLVPEFALAYNNRGNVLLALNNAAEATKDFDRALLLAPNYAGALNNRAIARLQSGEYAAAMADYQRAIELAPTTPSPYNGRGRALLGLGLPFAALRDFDRAVALEPSYRPAWRNRITVQLELDQIDSALEYIADALVSIPDDTSLLMQRAKIFSRQRKPLAALKDLSRVLELRPDDVVALTERGAMYARLQEPEAAQQDLDRALELDPRNALAYAYRGMMQRRQPDVGLADVDRALKLNPRLAPGHRIRGELLEALDRKDEAIAAFNKAIALDRTETEAWAGLQRLTDQRPPQAEILGETDLEGWTLWKAPSGRLIVRNARFEKMDVPLEMLGNTTPRLIDWSIRKDYKGIGVLRYSAGQASGKNGKLEDVELAVVVDLWRGETRGILPWRQGQTAAQWNWTDRGVLEVKAPEGTSMLTLRRRDSGTQIAGGTGQRNSSSGRSTTRRTTVRRSDGTVAQAPAPKKKSLFEMIFGF